MRGKGIRKVSGIGYGDHYVHMKIKIPSVLSAKQEALVKAYAEIETDTPGTVSGITKTKGGKHILYSQAPAKMIIFRPSPLKFDLRCAKSNFGGA